MFCLKWMLQSVPLWNSCPHLQCYFLEAPFFFFKFRWVKHPDLLLLYTPLQDSSAYSAESNLNVPWKKTNLKCQLQKQFSHRSVKYKHINSHLQTLQRHQMLHANNADDRCWLLTSLAVCESPGITFKGVDEGFSLEEGRAILTIMFRVVICGGVTTWKTQEAKKSLQSTHFEYHPYKN